MMEPIILPRRSDQKPLVSVVSITYNHESYIRACLDGFLMQQTSFPVEIILHDDASTDHTADIIREYYEKRPDLFHVIIEKENQYSKRKGICFFLFNYVQGKYIAMCEGDDYWTDPLKLQKQFDYMESHPACALCFHDIEETFEGVKEETSIFFSPGKKNGKDNALKWTMPTCSFFLRKEAADIYQSKWDKDFICGDLILALSAAEIGYFWGIDQKMGVYRHHPGGVTNTIGIDYRGRVKMYDAIKRHFNGYDSVMDYIKLRLLYTLLFYELLHKTGVLSRRDILSYILDVKSIPIHIKVISNCLFAKIVSLLSSK